MKSPDLERLESAIRLLASAMGNLRPSSQQVDDIIQHVLFDRDLGGIGGRNLWRKFTHAVITERELRNVLMAFSAANLSHWNRVSEPSNAEYASQALCLEIDNALFGREAHRHEIDPPDPWEV